VCTKLHQPPPPPRPPRHHHHHAHHHHRQYKWITFKIDDSGKTVIPDRIGGKNSPYEEFVAALPPNECRYGGAGWVGWGLVGWGVGGLEGSLKGVV